MCEKFFGTYGKPIYGLMQAKRYYESIWLKTGFVKHPFVEVSHIEFQNYM
jgi:hypothetical protein